MIPDDPPRRTFALIPLAILLLAVLNLSVPYRAISPGDVYDVGELIAIEGERTYPPAGHLYLTTVRLGPVRVAEAIRGWLDPNIDVVESSRIIPPGVSEEDADRIQTEQMTQSQQSAAVAAMSLLGREVRFTGGGVLVEDVLDEVPASGILQPGDVILAANGRTLCDTTGLVAAINAGDVGAEVPLRVQRGQQIVEVAPRTVARGEDASGEPMLGIQISSRPGELDLPIDISIDAGPIGGPSAGLMFALGIVDLLSEEDLTRGREVAGTGVIACTGDVGAVGGVNQKIVSAEAAGAELFLVPFAELQQACRAAGEMQILGIRRLDDAVAGLRNPSAPGVGTCS